MAATLARKARIKVSGAPVAVLAAATTAAGNIVYTISNADRRVIDRTAALVVKNGGVAIADTTTYTVNRLAGTITFATAVVRTITLDYSYLPLSTAAECRSFGFTVTAMNGDETTLEHDDTVRSQLQRDCAGSVGRWHINSLFRDALSAETPVVIEISVAAGVTPIARAWAVFPKIDLSGARDGYVEESVEFEGAADADGRSFTFLE